MTTFLVSDTHFGHGSICKFLRDDGTKLRPWDDVNEMDEALITYWNETVKPTDKVYHLGDIALKRKDLATLGKLNGDKVLIRGNHDIFKLEDYTKYFRDVRGAFVMDGVLFTHIPIHPDSKAKYIGNIHGHIHYRTIEDPWYQNVSVEVTNWRPIALEEVVSRFKAEVEENETTPKAFCWCPEGSSSHFACPIHGDKE